MKKNIEAQLYKIAEQHICGLEGRGTLEAKHSDELDFLDIAVWEIEAALKAAYELGRNAK